MLMTDCIYDFKAPPMAHLPGCACSVCWAHNYCDAILLFPCPALDLPPLAPPPDYYKFYDDTPNFKRQQRAIARFKRSFKYKR